MLPIIIPSENIYSINFNPVIDNQINRVEINTNIIKIEYGNILNSTLLFNFYEYDYSNKTIIPKYPNKENTNDFQFIVESSIIDGVQTGHLSATIKLLIDKKCEMPLLQDEQNNTIINHYKLESTKREQFFTVKGAAGEAAYDYEPMFTNEYTEYYTPKIVSYSKEKNEITLNYRVKAVESVGNIARYVLTDEIMLIGNYPTTNSVERFVGNGNKVFSFDGNELIQTTNTPTQESKYQSIIDKWESGKQTAIITCPITDYYDLTGSKVINVNTGSKMVFDIGDIVIPFCYTNHGDKPISYNKNFAPKQFKVVGTSISKKQGIQQTLTLQEI